MSGEQEVEEQEFQLTAKAQIQIPAFNGGEAATEWITLTVSASSLRAARAAAKDGHYDELLIAEVNLRYAVGSLEPGVSLHRRSVSEDGPNAVRRGAHSITNSIFGGHRA